MRGLRPDARQLGRLQELTDAALGHLELEQLLGALLERTRTLLDVDTCAILLLDAESKELVPRAAVGIEEKIGRGVRIPLGKGFAGRVAAERRPVVLRDVDHADVMNPLLSEKGIRSLLGVPLVVDGDVVGVLQVGSLDRRDFAPNEIELLQLAADRAAVAIVHARVFEAERAARAKLERVQAVTDIALAKGFAGRVAATGRPVVLDNVAEAEIVNPILGEKGIRSMLGVPLLVRGRAIGVLHVGTLSPRKFSQEDEELLQLVAERVAVAIERGRLHEELVLLDELRTNFVGIASHELRTPAASGYGAIATVVERGAELPSDTREALLQIAYEQADRLSRLLDQLLDLSRLDSRRIRVSPKPIVLQRVLAKIAHDAVPPGTPLELDVPDDLAVIADPLVLDRVVSNLLVNAARHGRPPIVLAAEQRDRHIRISVADHGEGVPADVRPRLFERFERGVDAPGSGLGLVIARAYARAHGGDLVYDDAGGGARFEVVIPRVDAT